MAYPGKDSTEDRQRESRESEDRPGAAREIESRVGAARGRFYGEGRSEERSSHEGTLSDRESLYFFPEPVSEARLRWILRQGSSEERAWAVSHLVRFAQWSDIWKYVSRDDVREMLPHLELPESLRAAWGRMLKVEAPVA